MKCLIFFALLAIVLISCGQQPAAATGISSHPAMHSAAEHMAVTMSRGSGGRISSETNATQDLDPDLSAPNPCSGKLPIHRMVVLTEH